MGDEEGEGDRSSAMKKEVVGVAGNSEMGEGSVTHAGGWRGSREWGQGKPGRDSWDNEAREGREQRREMEADE